MQTGNNKVFPTRHFLTIANEYLLDDVLLRVEFSNNYDFATV